VHSPGPTGSRKKRRRRRLGGPPRPCEVAGDTEQYIRRYLVLPAAAYLAVTLWIIATHAVQTFDCFPYIAAVSAAKRSGKTRLAEVLEVLVRRPWRGTAPSPAALYRMLDGAPTLLWTRWKCSTPSTSRKPP
jgi:hypothetical protein